jgi:dTDP-glucose 4,6-dehydratase
LRGERVFLTGGTGFVGTWLTEAFVWANARLSLGASASLLTRDRARFAARAPHLAGAACISFVDGDVGTFDPPAGSFRFVIHAATEALRSPSPDRPAATFFTDVDATRRVLEFAAGAGTERLLFTSSGAAYGPQPTDVDAIEETALSGPSTTDTNTAYGHAKRASEFLCAMYAQQYRMAIPIARLFAFVGPYLPLDANYAVGNFIRNALDGESIAVAGDGTPYRSYLYASDLARWCWMLLFEGRSARIYNVGSSDALSIRELATLVQATLAPDVAVTIAKAPIAGAPAPRYVPAVQRAADELGLHPTVSLVEGVRRTAAWHRQKA